MTLTGPGGTGKTRLGLQVAADVIDRFADGAFFVGLAPISDPGLVASTIALAIGIETGTRPAIDSLKDYCQGKQLLLILDNFEQILPAAPLVAELLGASAGLKLVVTSRSALRIRGEHEFPVPPWRCRSQEAASASGRSRNTRPSPSSSSGRRQSDRTSP